MTIYILYYIKLTALYKLVDVIFALNFFPGEIFNKESEAAFLPRYIVELVMGKNCCCNFVAITYVGK